jgi:hypothetical protein
LQINFAILLDLKYINIFYLNILQLFIKKLKIMSKIYLFTYHTIGGAIMSENKKWTPGEVVPKSGTYSAYSKEGENGGSLYLEKGKRFPATQHSGSYYVQAD